jgi:hypothetical protein
VIKVAVERMPEEDKRYIDFLALFMYAIEFDNGALDYCVRSWEAWRAEDAKREA